MSSDNQENIVKHRRHSSVGKINLGDSSVPGLQTIRSNHDIKLTKKEQFKQINKVSSKINDSDVLNKLFISLKILTYRYIWIKPIIIILLLNLIYLLSNNYTDSNPLHRFLFMSYQIPNTNPPLYEKGWKDFCFVFYMIIFFTFLREFMVQMILKPIAIHYGLKSKSKISRFTEQTYAIFYYGITGPFGLYIMKNSNMWFFNTKSFYENYPHTQHDWLFKFYYLFQAGFWSQQAIILMLQIEKPRKDFKELVFHHIVTILLISLSYMFNFTHMGLAIYITMDISDFFLGLSKTLNYINSSIEVPFFIFFMSVWIYTRHYLNIKILYSVLTEFLSIGPSILDFKTQQYKCWISQPMVFTLIFALQLVNLYWLFLILRIAIRVVLYNIKKDDRSDSESDDDDDDDSTSSSMSRSSSGDANNN
ncbi:sphingosine N-acyltransferase [Pichia kluyveri]|uniref:Sphingosine N-acyltransferase n=1 Tax=Pichia kluyveri TaxID=36015 RepID=A0AAV5R9B3_PICKL|nr:sphingosine N-acyltransferase [Pichia kluyveri]